jgi:hypothetical protein
MSALHQHGAAGKVGAGNAPAFHYMSASKRVINYERAFLKGLSYSNEKS